MNRIQESTLDRLIGGTHNIIDCHKCLAAIAYGEKQGIKQEAIRMVLDARANWLTWITLTQREWQAGTRNSNKARHHDSISIRERYVRC